MTGNQGYQPAFFVPKTILFLILTLLLVYLLRHFLLADYDQFIVVMFGILPAKYLPGVAATYPGGVWMAIPSFITYAFLHADFAHLAINSAWLLAFGTAVVRAIGPARFFILYLISAVFAAAVHIAVDMGSLVPMVGASGAIAGMMGAAFRVSLPVFSEGPDTKQFSLSDKTPEKIRGPIPVLPLGDSKFLLLSGVWVVTNLLFGFTGIRVSEQVLMIAWDAHIAGFVAGALLIPFFIKGGGIKPVTNH